MKKVVVKIGGSLAIDEAKLADFVSAVSALPGAGCQVAVVHGGGKDINENIALLKEQPTFTVDKNKIKQIIYQNGTSDSFELNEPAKQANGQDIKKNEKKILITQENVLGYIMNSICNRPEAKAKRFTIEYGNKFFSDHYITVSGACNSGKKHGQFNLYDGNRLVMKTKFNNDSEVKTDCVSRPANRRIPQRFCFDAYFLQQ